MDPTTTTTTTTTPTPAPPLPIHLTADTLSAALRAGQTVLEPVRGAYFGGLYRDRPCGCAITVASVGAGLIDLAQEPVAGGFLWGRYFHDDGPETGNYPVADDVRAAIAARWPTVADRWLAAAPDLWAVDSDDPGDPERLGQILEGAWENLHWSLDHIIASLEAIGA